MFLTKNLHLENKFFLTGSKKFLNSNFQKLNRNYLTLSARYSVNLNSNIHSKIINRSENNQASDLKK